MEIVRWKMKWNEMELNEIIKYDTIWYDMMWYDMVYVPSSQPLFVKASDSPRHPLSCQHFSDRHGLNRERNMGKTWWRHGGGERMVEGWKIMEEAMWETLRCLRLLAIWGEGNGLFRSNMIPVNNTMLSSKLFHESCWHLYGLAASKSPCTTDWRSLAWCLWESQSQTETKQTNMPEKTAQNRNLAPRGNCICAFQALGSCMLENL